MSNSTELFKAELAKNVEDFRQRIKVLASSIPPAAFWTRPFPFGNSMGNLVAHLTGNLNYYIGSQIQQTGYVRTRDYEFNRQRSEDIQATMTAFDAAIDILLATIENMTDEQWSQPYTAVGADGAGTQLSIILRCTMHLHHHIGQMIYLRKAINGEVD